MVGAAPLVSVLMPVYNGAKYTRLAIESILGQTFTDFELVVVDDGSTDETPSVLDEYRRADARVRLYRQDNQGHVGALIAGLERVRGTYVARMDADDVSLSTRLAAQVDYLESQPSVGAVGSAAMIIDAHGNTVGPLRFPAEHWVIRWALCFYSAIIHPTVMMRRAALLDVGGYSRVMKHAEDYDLWRRLAQRTRLANLETVFLLLRKHTGNVSESNPAGERGSSVQVSSMIMSDLLAENVPLDLVERVWEARGRSHSDARAVAQLVYRLYKAIAQTIELTESEADVIRHDAAQRLYAVVRPWAAHVTMWRQLLRAYSLDSSLLVDPIRRRLSFARRLSPRMPPDTGVT